jgi:phosphoglucomutase
MAIFEVSTQPYPDQRSGTAGLRRPLAVFQQPHYLENYLQSVFDCMPELAGHTLVTGGDGRYHNDSAIRTAIAMAAANGVRHVVVGQNGILSTPAASHLIRSHRAAGGLIFTASHNPAGPQGDFGLKLNLAHGGQAGDGLLERIFQHSRTLTSYRIADLEPAHLDLCGIQSRNGMEIEVVDSTESYTALMQRLFDFDAIRNWLQAGHRLQYDALHAVTGPYARRLFVESLGVPAECVQNSVPREDFGGGHPDPNRVHARHLVTLSENPDAPDLIAASDGDGDRNMILGRGVFVSPCDSLAVLAAHLPLLPGYRDGLRGVARSLPTSRALDRVARELYIDCYETPSGWKFFSNLLETGRITLCGEEAFGTSSSHIREKDGLWAILAWLNVLAVTRLSVREVLEQHWRRFGRHYYLRHDYEDLPVDDAMNVIHHLAGELPGLAGRRFGDWTVTQADEFTYHDPVDGSLAVNQGLRVVFGDDARFVLRQSGTGTHGATLRLYLERYEQGNGRLDWDPAEALAPLANIAGELTQIAEIAGCTGPSLVT